MITFASDMSNVYMNDITSLLDFGRFEARISCFLTDTDLNEISSTSYRY